MIEYATGNLFDIRNVEALAHGVNCVGAMRAGIAGKFRDRYPGMFQAYRAKVVRPGVRLGDCIAWANPADGKWIYCLASQYSTGPNADLGAISESLTRMLRHAKTHGVERIGMPRIGCGIGGLAWPDVRIVIERVAGASPIAVVVVSLPTESD